MTKTNLVQEREVSKIPKLVRLVLKIGEEYKPVMERMACEPFVEGSYIHKDVRIEGTEDDPQEWITDMIDIKIFPTDTFTEQEYQLFASGADIVETKIGVYNKVRDEARIMRKRDIIISKFCKRDYSKTCNGSTPLRSLTYNLEGNPRIV